MFPTYTLLFTSWLEIDLYSTPPGVMTISLVDGSRLPPWLPTSGLTPTSGRWATLNHRFFDAREERVCKVSQLVVVSVFLPYLKIVGITSADQDIQAQTPRMVLELEAPNVVEETPCTLHQHVSTPLTTRTTQLERLSRMVSSSHSQEEEEEDNDSLSQVDVVNTPSHHQKSAPLLVEESPACPLARWDAESTGSVHPKLMALKIEVTVAPNPPSLVSDDHSSEEDELTL
jgi:hypothetical protein